jgi:hypothetical protein
VGDPLLWSSGDRGVFTPSDQRIALAVNIRVALGVNAVTGRGGLVKILPEIQKDRGEQARHHIGEPAFLKPSRSMVHIGG